MNFPEFQKWCVTLCAWREARGEGYQGMRAVIHVINNRAILWKKSWSEIVFQRLQFTSMTFGADPEISLVPMDNDSRFIAVYKIADAVFTGADHDPTYGATHYFNPDIVLPIWAATMQKVATIGHHDFYRES